MWFRLVQDLLGVVRSRHHLPWFLWELFGPFFNPGQGWYKNAACWYTRCRTLITIGLVPSHFVRKWSKARPFGLRRVELRCNQQLIWNVEGRNCNTMRVTTICKGTKHLTMTEMPVKAGTIVLGMRGNPYFPEAGPLVDEVERCAKAMAEANWACLDGGRIATANRKERRRELDRAITLLFAYVKGKSHSNVAMALSSGFELRKTPHTLPPLGQPENLRVERSEGGHLTLRWTPLHGARIYEVFIQEEASMVEGVWQSIAFTSRARLRMVRTDAGKYVRFKVCAVSAAGQSPVSQEVRALVP